MYHQALLEYQNMTLLNSLFPSLSVQLTELFFEVWILYKLFSSLTVSLQTQGRTIYF